MNGEDEVVVSNVEQFRMPDVGEGLTEAEIVTWKAKPGDSVTLNQIIVEVETAKALTELPSPFTGVVTELLVPEGATVAVGTPIIAINTAAGSGAVQLVAAEDVGEFGSANDPAPEGPASVLVGYGPQATPAVRRRRFVPPPAAPWSPARPAAVTASGAVVHMLAKPPVRKLARDLGVDLTAVVPTGSGGIVTRADVEHAVAPAANSASGGSADARQTRIPIRGVRRHTAAAMVASAFTAPHVTEWLSVDVTATMRLVDRLREEREFSGVKMSPLVVVAKVMLIAVRRNPQINASWDEAAGEIVIHHGVNLGIAVATPRGLVVPNIKDASQLGLRELADALAELTETAREGRSSAPALTGGTITLTNVGVFGVDSGTPILNPGEAAILAFGQVRKMPWVHKGKVRPRWVTQLAVSFDHRVVDGELGSRFLTDVGAVLEDPALALVWC